MRRLEIYLQALPAIERVGHSIRLDETAAAANLSLGGLRYYFPARDDLIYFPLLPGTCDAAYELMVRRHSLGTMEPGPFLAWFLDDFANGAVASRPATRMALEAGGGMFQRLANRHPEGDWLEVRRAIAVLGGHRRAIEAGWLRRFLRRQFIAASLEERATARDIALDLHYALGVRR